MTSSLAIDDRRSASIFRSAFAMFPVGSVTSLPGDDLLRFLLPFPLKLLSAGAISVADGDARHGI